MMVWKMYLLSNMAILGSYVRVQGCSIHSLIDLDKFPFQVLLLNKVHQPSPNPPASGP